MKKCPTCKRTLPFSEFSRKNRASASDPAGWNFRCKSCTQEYQKRWYEQTGRSRREAAKLKQYALTVEQYEQMLQSQADVCAICSRPEPSQDERRLAVDHDHRTGQVRGLLCSRCNRALGGFGDSPALLRKALRYLTKNQGTPLE